MTPQDYFVTLLDGPEARAATRRVPRLLADFEESILMEDMKTCGMKVKRLREMLKFFYRTWTELGDRSDGFLLDDDECAVHGFLKDHLVARGGMLLQELGNIAYTYLRDWPEAAEPLRFDHVLVDDFQNLNKASQMAFGLVARVSLMACGNENEQVPTVEPYPYAAGFTGFCEAYPDAEQFVLAQSMRPGPHITAAANALARQDGMNVQMQAWAGEEGRCAYVTGALSADAGVASAAAKAAAVDVGAAPSTVGTDAVKLVKWPLPNAEFLGVAAYVKHRLADAAHPIRPRDIFLAVPNAIWGRALAKVLNANDIPTTEMIGYRALKGDPRTFEKCADLRTYTALNLVARPDDLVAWRCWCGFGDYLTNSNHWCRFEKHAIEQGKTLVQVFDEELASLPPATDVQKEAAVLGDPEHPAAAEKPFLGAALIAERWREGRALIEEMSDARGFALMNRLYDACGQPSADFKELLEPLCGTESAPELYARMRARQELRFADRDAVRIGLVQMACGQSFDTVVVTGAVDGFCPSTSTFGLELDEERQTVIRAEERRQLYAAMVKASYELVFSCFSQDESNTASALGMWSRRIRMVDGKSMAILSPSSFIDELGDAAPGFESSI